MKPLRATGGFTMTELMVASAVGSVIMACLAVGAVTLQRGYSAAEHQTRSQLDQMRIVDYISRDLRRAVAVRVENSGPNIGTKLVIDVPDLSGRDSASGDLLEPALVNGDVRYGSAATTVAYYVEGIAFIRQEASAKTVIANKRIEEFKADRSQFPLVSFELTFTPQFSRNAGADARSAAKVSTTVWVRNAAGRLL